MSGQCFDLFDGRDYQRISCSVEVTKATFLSFGFEAAFSPVRCSVFVCRCVVSAPGAILMDRNLSRFSWEKVHSKYWKIACGSICCNAIRFLARLINLALIFPLTVNAMCCTSLKGFLASAGCLEQDSAISHLLSCILASWEFGKTDAISYKDQKNTNKIQTHVGKYEINIEVFRPEFQKLSLA